MLFNELTKKEFYEAPQIIQELYLSHCTCKGMQYDVYMAAVKDFPEYFTNESAYDKLPPHYSIPQNVRSEFLKAQTALVDEIYKGASDAETVLDLRPEFLEKRNALFNDFFNPYFIKKN